MTLDIQFYSMLASAATGLWLGASFDTYRRFTGSSRRFRWSLVFNDIFFWLLQGLIFFYVLLKVNEGEVRFYLFLALLLGYSVYRSLFENIYLKILEQAIRIISGTYRLIVKTILVLFINPLKWLLKVLLALSMILLTTIWRIVYYILWIFLVPFRWLGKKYVQQYGIPFHSLFNKAGSMINKISELWKGLFKK